MHRRRTLVVCLLSFAAILLGTGCGSSGNANIRLVNALSNQSSLDMLIDSSSTATSVGYGAASGRTTLLPIKPPVSARTPMTPHL